jgi:iron complex transport system substrate-binding protein
MINSTPIVFFLATISIFALGLLPPRIEPRQPIGAASLLTHRAAAEHVVIYPPFLSPYLVIDGGARHVAGSSQIALGAVSGSELSDIYPNIADIPALSKSVGPSDLERLLSVHPDVVISWANNVFDVERLGLPAIGLRVDPRRPAETLSGLWRLFGSITGRPQRVETLLSLLRSQRAELQQSLPERQIRPRIVVLYPGSGIGQIGGRYAHLNTAIELVGARNPGAIYPTTIDSSIETLFRLDPDIILLTDNYGRTPRELYADARWQPLRAVRTHRIYAIPRLSDIDGLVDAPLFSRWLAEIVWGDEMPDCWRERFRQILRVAFNTTSSLAAENAILRIKENSYSSGYSRFYPPSSLPEHEMSCPDDRRRRRH